MSGLSKIGRRRGSWIVVGVAAVAAAIYIVLFYVPKMRAIAATMAQLDAKQVFILDAQKSKQVCEQSQRELQAAIDYGNKHAPQLLKHDELPLLYGQISHIAKSHDVLTPKFEPLPAVEFESLQKRTIGLGVTGSFTAIHRLVRDLEALPAGIWIHDMKMRGPREAGKPVECDLILVVFVDNPEKID